MSERLDDIAKTWARSTIVKISKQLQAGLFPVDPDVRFDPYDDGLDVHRGGYELIAAAFADCSQSSLPIFLKLLGEWCQDPTERKILHEAFDKIIASDEIYQGLHVWDIDGDDA